MMNALIVNYFDMYDSLEFSYGICVPFVHSMQY